MVIPSHGGFEIFRNSRVVLYVKLKNGLHNNWVARKGDDLYKMDIDTVCIFFVLHEILEHP